MNIFKNIFHYRVVVSITIFAFFITLFTSTIWTHSRYQYDVKNAHEQIKEVIETFNPLLSMAFDSKQTKLFQTVLIELAKKDFIASVQFESKDTPILIFSSDEHRPESNQLENNQISNFVYPVYSQNENQTQIGQLTIVPNQYIKTNSFSFVKFQTMILFIYALIIILLSSYLFNQMISKPIRKITDKIHQITPGDKCKIQIPLPHPKNEIIQLVLHINKLLDKFNHQLEIEKKLRTNSEEFSKQFRLLFERANAGIGLMNDKHQLIIANTALLNLLSHQVMQSEKETAQVKGHQFEPVDFEQFFLEPQKIRHFIKKLKLNEDTTYDEIDIQLRHKAHTCERWVHCIFSKVENIDKPHQHFLEVVIYDITAQAQREQNIIYDAEHDPLTLLFNRRACFQRLQDLIHHAKAKSRNIAIFMIDLDGFKQINDTYGHDTGDQVIQEIAARIKHFFRASDIVARWGGDEFLIGFSYSSNYQAAVKNIAEDLQAKMISPVILRSNEQVHVGASIGISLFPAHDTQLEGLIEKADQAMYNVKHQEKNQFHFYQNT